MLERLTEAAFGQRRKMLRSSLKSVPGALGSARESLGIDPQRRAETLSVDDGWRWRGRSDASSSSGVSRRLGRGDGRARG